MARFSPFYSPNFDEKSGGDREARRGQFWGEVVRNDVICDEHYRLILRIEGFPASVPGQIVQIDCAGEVGAGGELDACEKEWRVGGANQVGRDLAGARAYLRRPFSIGGRREVGEGVSEIEIIYRVVGKGTGSLAELEMGKSVSLIGPLGKGFVLPEEDEAALLVGGGVGIPPMFYLAQVLGKLGRRAVGFVGAQRKGLVPLTISPCMPAPSAEGEPVLNATEFAEHGFATVVTTDDGSWGMKGFVTAALRRFIEKEKEGRKLVVYCCGPTPMMRATARVCEELGVVCQVSLEQPMACGMGTCQSCVVRVKTGEKPGASSQKPEGSGLAWVYKLTCTDGPVFDSREIVWEKS